MTGRVLPEVPLAHGLFSSFLWMFLQIHLRSTGTRTRCVCTALLNKCPCCCWMELSVWCNTVGECVWECQMNQTHVRSHALRSPLMALGGPRQGRPSCCSFQLEPCQGAIPRSAFGPNWANFIFMKEKCKLYIHSTLGCSHTYPLSHEACVCKCVCLHARVGKRRRRW